MSNKGKLCLGHCLFSCQTRSVQVQKKDFVCDSCATSRVPLSRVRFSRDADVCGKKGNNLYEVSYKVYRHVFGDYNMLVFRSEQSAQSLTDKVGAAKLLTSSGLPEFFNGESAWRDGVPFLLNTHDHKLVPKPLGGASGKLAQPAEHRYKCPHCDRTFQQTGNLNSHIRIVHLGQRRFECEICHRKFPRKQNLQYHMRTHTGELPYRCSRCNRGFARKDHLRRHENKPHPYACGTGACKRCFMFKTCVELHRRRAHNVADVHDPHVLVDENNSRLYDDDSPERRKTSSSPPPPTDTITQSLSNMRFQPVTNLAAGSSGNSSGGGNSGGGGNKGDNESEESESEFRSMFSAVRNNPNLCISGPSLAGVGGNSFRVPRVFGESGSGDASGANSAMVAAAAAAPASVKLEHLRPPPPDTGTSANVASSSFFASPPPAATSSASASSSTASLSLIDTLSISPPPYPSPSPVPAPAPAPVSSPSRSPSRTPSRSPMLMPMGMSHQQTLAATQQALSQGLIATFLNNSASQINQTTSAAILSIASQMQMAAAVARSRSRSSSPAPTISHSGSAPASNSLLSTLSLLTPPPLPPSSQSRSPSPSRLASPPPLPIPPTPPVNHSAADVMTATQDLIRATAGKSMLKAEG